MDMGSRMWADWAGALSECKRNGRALIGPCPVCGGVDRFHVTRKRDGGALVGCRGCIDGQSPDVRREQFKRIVEAVFGPVGPGRSPNPFLPPKPVPKAEKPKRLPLAARLWADSVRADVGPVRAYLSRRRIWPKAAEAQALPTESLRWLMAATAQRLLPRPRRDDGSRPCPLPASADGCLVYAFRTEENRLTAVSLEGLTAEGAFPPEGRFRRTYGSRSGAFFSPARSAGGALVVCEGELDALAGLALGLGERDEFAGAEIRAYGGTANLTSAELPADRPVLIVSDGDAKGWQSALELCKRHPHAEIRYSPAGTDLAQMMADTIEERVGMYEHEAGLPPEQAERRAWAWAGLLPAKAGEGRGHPA